MGAFSEEQRTTISRRMVKLAEEYLCDEKILCESLSDSWSGAPLLGVLGLEIHLKAVLLFETGERPSNHDFLSIWNKLPKPVQDEVLNEAKNQYPTDTDFRNLEAIFTALQKVFVKGRYSYEINDGRSDAEASEVGALWIDEGGTMEEAELSYYPRERDALIHALRDYWKARKASD